MLVGLICDALIKVDRTYRLSLAWVLNMVDLADQMYDTHVSGTSPHLLPEEGEKLKWTFSQLQRLDEFWIHMVLTLCNTSEEKILYQWIPHPWFHLMPGTKTPAFQNALVIGEYKVKSIIGNRNFLDKRSSKLTTANCYEFSYAEGPFEGKNAEYYSVCENYFLKIKMDSQTESRIAGVYDSIKTAKEITTSPLINELYKKGRIRVELEHSPKKASGYLKKFRDYFGDPHK